MAQRAFWDALEEAVGEGRYDGLWNVLQELQQAMRAIASASATTLADLDDKFDVAWLKVQVAHGALETVEVHALLDYLCERIAAWQAPADDVAMRSWVESVKDRIADTADMPLEDFIRAHLLPFARGAIGHVGTVYQRTLALTTERELVRAEEQARAQAQMDASEAMQQD